MNTEHCQFMNRFLPSQESQMLFHKLKSLRSARTDRDKTLNVMGQ